MGEKIVVGPLPKGLQTDKIPVFIDNESFPVLQNAYQWRGRAKRKRGTSLLGRLERFFNSASGSYNINVAFIRNATQANPCVLTANNTFSMGQTITISGVSGMTQLNGNSYSITSVTSTSITINVDSTGFGAYVSGGVATLDQALSTGNGNLLTGFGLQTNGNIVPGSVVITDVTASKIYTDLGKNGILNPVGVAITGATQANPCVLTATNTFSIGDSVIVTGVTGMTQLNGNTYQITNVSGTTITLNVDSTGFSAYISGGIVTDISIVAGTINYATGAITIVGGGSDAINAQFLYYPDLPAMGERDLLLIPTDFPGTIGFDTVYSYNISTTFPYNIWDVSFYKNPLTGTYSSYVQKTNVTPLTWNGQDYQQFWTINYQGAFWETNGINQPFSTTNIGMSFQKPNSATQTSATTVDFVFSLGSVLVIGDFVFANEFTGSSSASLNFQTGYVIAITTMTNTYTVKFPNANIGGAGLTPGILQFLTTRSDPTKDCIRWYDGDPTDGNPTTPTLNGHHGWVNFCPPLSEAVYSVDNKPPGQYYLVGARVIFPFKDRILFFGPVIQTSSPGSQLYLQDTIIYSLNGTPYYTASFDGSVTGAVTSAATNFIPILVPLNQTATPASFFEDSFGFGGFLSAGVAQPIISVINNEDVLILGFSNKQARLVYTGDDLIPFNIFIINSELGSEATFSVITLDRGGLSIGEQGIIIASQISAQRIDLDIPDQVFQFNITNNGIQRISAQRDFINEWIYFSYPDNQITYKFPNQTLLYNYRDSTWAIFYENYTSYGQFRPLTGVTWATLTVGTWNAWDAPWNAGASTLLQPLVIAGNQQGFIMIREGDTTNEGTSLYIQNIVGNLITSPDHCLNNGDFIVISNTIGTIGAVVNGTIFSVYGATQNTFLISDGKTSSYTGTYVGGGLITRMYVPLIKTKEFPVSWGMGRKTRLGPQQYLFSTTNAGQIELQIFLSQDTSMPYNQPPIVPDISQNNTLIYSDILYTCPESTNLGLTPANINLNMVTAQNQDQIWHRMNTSLLGDTVQIGFTLSEAQMRDVNFSNQFTEIELHAFILDVSPSQVLA